MKALKKISNLLFLLSVYKEIKNKLGKDKVEMLKKKLSSRKFILVVIGALVFILNKATGLNLNNSELFKILVLFLGYSIVEAIRDIFNTESQSQLEKLCSRKFLLTIFGGLVIFLNKVLELNLSNETISRLIEIILGYNAAEGIVDTFKLKNKNKT